MKEADIRPKEIFDRYLELSRQDIDTFFRDKSGFEHVACPACGEDRPEPAFDKLGFRYVNCAACDTLYLSPRPTEAMMDVYYEHSAAVKFWGSDFYKHTAAARREKMFRPRARLLAELAESYRLPRPIVVADVGAGYGLFLEEVRDTGKADRIVAIEPAPNLAAICRERGFEVVEAMLERVPEGSVQASCASAFEVIEHVPSPVDFLKGMARVMAPDGIALVTTLTRTGFDIRVLGAHAKAVYPPYHINLMSVEGMRRLVERAGLRLLALETPGKLDVDIVRNTLAEIPQAEVGAFERWIACEADEEQRQSFQDFLAANRLSSHIRIVVGRA